MTTWKEWKIINHDKIQHVVGFEEKFVDEVLSKIPLIEPDDVIPQYPFTDAKGVNRRIDFMILNNTKGYLLPIELDGYSKLEIEKGYDKFNNLLERQNSLTAKFGTLLRYTNKKMLNEPRHVIKEITDLLNQQYQRKIAEEQLKKAPQEDAQKIYQEFLTNLDALTKKNTEEYYQKIIEDLQIKEQQAQLSENHKQTNELANTIQMMQVQLNRLNQDLKKNRAQQGTVHMAPPLVVPKASKFGFKAIAISIALIAVAGLGAAQMLKSKSADANLNATTTQSFMLASNGDKSTPLNRIKASEASAYIGERHTVCGKLVQITKFAKGNYLNLDAKYPNHSLTVVVWDDDRHQFARFDQHLNQIICVNNKITSYKGKPQITLKFADQLSFL